MANPKTIGELDDLGTLQDGDLIEVQRPGAPDKSGYVTWQEIASGDVVGPESVTDGEMALFDGTTGKLIKGGGAPFSGDYDDLSNKPSLGSAASADTEDFATAAQGSKADTAVQPEDLAAVATSGDYNDLENTPHLGTAAFADAEDFATAAQGAKADSALQPDALSEYTKTADLGGLATKDKVSVAEIDATGTADSTTFLRGDGEWAEVQTTGEGDALAPVPFDLSLMVDGETTSFDLSDPPYEIESLEEGMTLLYRDGVPQFLGVHFTVSGSSIVFSTAPEADAKIFGWHLAPSQLVAVESHTHAYSDILGLGNAATKDVGTTVGTVAAGDDPRFGTWDAEVVSKEEAEEGTSSTPRKWTAERVADAIKAIGGKQATAVPFNLSSLVDGVETSFDLGESPYGIDSLEGGLTLIFRDGVPQFIGVDFTVSGSVLTFSEAPEADAKVYGWHLAAAELVALEQHTHTLSDITNAGDAAGKNVGTTAGTVAAGDDSRIVGAVQQTGTGQTLSGQYAHIPHDYGNLSDGNITLDPANGMTGKITRDDTSNEIIAPTGTITTHFQMLITIVGTSSSGSPILTGFDMVEGDLPGDTEVVAMYVECSPSYKIAILTKVE